MKFRKKPIVIEARQLTDEESCWALVDWIRNNGGRVLGWCWDNPGTALPTIERYILIETLEGNHKAQEFDWIIQGVKGEFYPCKPDIFEMTYEPVENG
jgi:hypothetical protein